MKDKKPLYRVLSLKGLGGDIESRVSQSHPRTKQARRLPLFKECGKDIPSNIVSHFKIVIKTCFYIALWSVNCKQHHFPEWEETILSEVGKTALAA